MRILNTYRVGKIGSLRVTLFAAIMVGSALAANDPPSALELPVRMQQNISAGVTPAGTQVQAKLTEATLTHGVVIPRGAILSGTVDESSAKAADSPSRLRVRFTSVQWKGGSSEIDAYLTPNYYATDLSPQSDPSAVSPGMHGSVGVTMGGGRTDQVPGRAGNWPGDPDARDTTGPGMGREPDPMGSTIPPAPTQSEPHKRHLSGIDLSKAEDGSPTLISKKHSIRIDKSTTYVLGVREPTAK